MLQKRCILSFSASPTLPGCASAERQNLLPCAFILKQLHGRRRGAGNFLIVAEIQEGRDHPHWRVQSSGTVGQHQ